jgi:hypothetical protein
MDSSDHDSDQDSTSESSGSESMSQESSADSLHAANSKPVVAKKSPLKAHPTNDQTHMDSLNKSGSKADNETKTGLVLTHVIDGYVIKESSKPFPVKSTTAADKNGKKDPSNIKSKDLASSTVSFVCLQCGKASSGSKKKLYNQNSLCSSVCMKRYNKKKRSSSENATSKKSKKSAGQAADSSSIKYVFVVLFSEIQM